MKLAAYLELPGKRASDIARKCDCSVSTITRIAKGEKAPSMKMAAAIREATDGAVTPDDYLPPFIPAGTDAYCAVGR